MSIAELEPAPANPLENSAGLSPEQESEREKLKRYHTGASESYQESRKATVGDYGYLGFVPRAVDRAMDKYSEKAAAEAAGEHYKANEGSYQEQAVKDAAAEGVHTDFGTDSETQEHAQPIQVTQAEFSGLQARPASSPETTEFMTKHGLTPGEEPLIQVEEGKPRAIVTTPEDFGTPVDPLPAKQAETATPEAPASDQS